MNPRHQELIDAAHGGGVIRISGVAEEIEGEGIGASGREEGG